MSVNYRKKNRMKDNTPQPERLKLHQKLVSSSNCYHLDLMIPETQIYQDNKYPRETSSTLVNQSLSLEKVPRVVINTESKINCPEVLKIYRFDSACSKPSKPISSHYSANRRKNHWKEKGSEVRFQTDSLTVKEDVDALHTASSEILGCSNELSSNH